MSVIDWQDGVTPVDDSTLSTLESIYRKGQANGYASLDAGTKVPVAQLPAGTANGVASLDATGKVPLAQLPDTASGAYVPLDGVQVAGTRILASKLLAGDAQPAFRIMGDGKHEWGPGGATAPDTNLYRSGAAALVTDGTLQASGSPNSLITKKGLMINSDQDGAKLVFGWQADTNLYRSAANQLKTDDDFYIGTNRQAITAATGTLNWGNGTSFDTWLRRESVGNLASSGALFVNLGQSVANHVYLGYTGSGSGSYILLGNDTNLYRSGADSLRTDDHFAVALNCYVEGDLWIKNNVSNWLFITGDDGGGGGFPASFPASIVVNLNGSVYKIPLV